MAESAERDVREEEYSCVGVIARVRVADNGEQLYVVVSDNYGRSVTSSVATLTIQGISRTFVNTGTRNAARECHTTRGADKEQTMNHEGHEGCVFFSLPLRTWNC